MLECRYHGWCSLEYDNDFGAWCPCIGDGVEACMVYEPMPDAEALTALADDMERIADENRMTGMMGIGRARSWADRIREALGVADA